MLILVAGTAALVFSGFSGYTRQHEADPYADLPRIERDAAMRREWPAKFVATGRSIEGLPVLVIQEYPPLPAYYVDGAARAASEIVYGVVVAQRVVVDAENPHQGRVISKIKVREALKGEVGDEVELSQPGTPEELAGRVYIVHQIFDPVVSIRAEVIVFSEERDSRSRLRSLDWTIITFEDGRANAPSSRFSDISEMEVEEVLQRIRLAVAAAEQRQ